MNYYRRYVGDFQRDTGHLSLAEVGAYDRLLDHFYATERGLPDDLDSLCRIARAVSKDERAAVQIVTEAYFPVADDGLRHNPRADRELAKAEPAIAAARTNGLRGGRPRKNPVGFPDITQDEPNGVHPPTTNHQPPSSNPQPPSEKSKALSGKPDYMDQAREVLDYLNRNTGHRYRPVKANLGPIEARLRSGVSPLQIKEVIHHKCEQWLSNAEMAQYLRPETLFRASKFESYLGEINGGSDGVS